MNEIIALFKGGLIILGYILIVCIGVVLLSLLAPLLQAVVDRHRSIQIGVKVLLVAFFSAVFILLLGTLYVW